MTVNVQKTAGETPEKMSVPSRAPQPHPLMSLRGEIDRLFDSMFASPWRMLDLDPFRRFAAFGDMTPQTNVRESDAAIDISVELPGLEEKDVEVNVSDGVLTLRGEKREEHEDKGVDYHVSERRFGMFHRSFPLPDTIDQDKIAARLEKGVLTVSLPKTAKPDKPVRKIEVKGS